MSNEIAKFYEQAGDPFEVATKLGGAMTRCGMFGFKSAEQGKILAISCIMEGKNPIQMMRQFDIIEGRLSMNAKTMLAEFQNRGGRIVWLKSTAEVCTAKFSHETYCPKGVDVSVTLKELIESGVAVGKNGALQSNYKRSPKQMLRARVVSEGIGMVDPGIVAGVYTPEEIRDGDFKNEDDDRRTAPDNPLDATEEPIEDKKTEAKEPEAVDVEFQAIDPTEPESEPEEQVIEVKKEAKEKPTVDKAPLITLKEVSTALAEWVKTTGLKAPEAKKLFIVPAGVKQIKLANEKQLIQILSSCWKHYKAKKITPGPEIIKVVSRFK